MITLRPLLADEYASFLDYFLPDYAAEIAASYGLPLTEAHNRAAAETARDLPQGLATPHQHLLAIVDAAGTTLGSLWVHLDPETRTGFLNDLYVLPHHRRQGHAAAALQRLSAWLRAQGMAHLRLRVAVNNPAAARLYARQGFHVTGTNMALPLT